jgi:hypothetical protein
MNYLTSGLLRVPRVVLNPCRTHGLSTTRGIYEGPVVKPVWCRFWQAEMRSTSSSPSASVDLPWFGPVRDYAMRRSA